MPNADIVRSIYSAIVDGHVAGAGLEEGVARLGQRLVDATIELHRMVGGGLGWVGWMAGVLVDAWAGSLVEFRISDQLGDQTNQTKPTTQSKTEIHPPPTAR
jgi:hypothetical protein